MAAHLCVGCWSCMPQLDPDLVYFLGSSTSEDLARAKLKQENKPHSDKDISAAKVDVWTAMRAKSRTALLVAPHTHTHC